MTEAKAIRNSVEGRDGYDPFRNPADAIGRLRAVSPRGPSATELHKRTETAPVSLVMVCRGCGRERSPHAAGCYVARRYDWPEDAA